MQACESALPPPHHPDGPDPFDRDPDIPNQIFSFYVFLNVESHSGFARPGVTKIGWLGINVPGRVLIQGPVPHERQPPCKPLTTDHERGDRSPENKKNSFEPLCTNLTTLSFSQWLSRPKSSFLC